MAAVRSAPASAASDTRLMEPTREQVERGAAALIPFVEARKLSLSPEDLDELAYAVLVHHDSSASWEDIDRAVREQIAEVRQGHAEMLEAICREKRQQYVTGRARLGV